MRKPFGWISSSWLGIFPFALALCLLVPSCQQKVKPPVEKVTIAVPVLPHAALKADTTACLDHGVPFVLQ